MGNGKGIGTVFIPLYFYCYQFAILRCDKKKNYNTMAPKLLISKIISKWGSFALEHLVQGYGGVFHIRTYGTAHVGRWPFFHPFFYSYPTCPQKILLGARGWGKSTMGAIQLFGLKRHRGIQKKIS